MPDFASDPATTGQVVPVWRRRGFAVDIGDPLIDVRIGQHAVLTVGTHRDDGIYAMRVGYGQRVKAVN